MATARVRDREGSDGGAPWRVVRDAFAAVAIGAAGHAVSCIVVGNEGSATGFGAQWQRMSEAPWAWLGPFPQRILSPLLAHALGVDGPRFGIFLQGLAVLLLASVHFVSRRLGSSFADATVVVLAIAATGAVQMYKSHWVGFPDALTTTLLVWSLLAAPRPVLFWSLFAVNLLQHELVALLLPWLWFLRRRAGGGGLADAAAVAGIVLAYAAFHAVVARLAAEGVYDAGYFAHHLQWPGGTVVVVALAATHALLAFGPLLAIAAWHAHDPRWAAERHHFALVALGLVAIFSFAYDWSRHTNLLAVPLVVACRRFAAAGHRGILLAATAALVVANLAVPPWAEPQWPTIQLIGAARDSGVLVSIERPDGAAADVVFAPLGDVLVHWLPAAAPTLLAVGALLAATWLAGVWFARRARFATPPGPVRAVAGRATRGWRFVVCVGVPLLAAALILPAWVRTDLGPALVAAVERLQREHGPAATFLTTEPLLGLRTGVRAACLGAPRDTPRDPAAMWRWIEQMRERSAGDFFATSRSSVPLAPRALAAAAPAGSAIMMANDDVLVVRLPDRSAAWLQRADVRRSADGTMFELAIDLAAGADAFGAGFTVMPPHGEARVVTLANTPDGCRARLAVPAHGAGRWRFVPGALRRDGAVLQGPPLDVLVP